MYQNCYFSFASLLEVQKFRQSKKKQVQKDIEKTGKFSATAPLKSEHDVVNEIEMLKTSYKDILVIITM